MIFNRIKLFKLLTILGIFFVFLLFKPALAQTEIDFYFFYGQGCPHCEKFSSVLADWQKKYPQLKVNSFEVFFNQENRKLYFALAKAYQLEVNDIPVPLVFIGEKSSVGYNENIRNQIHQEILRCLQQHCPSPLERLKIDQGKEKPYNLFRQKTRSWLIILFGIVLIGFLILKISRRRKFSKTI